MKREPIDIGLDWVPWAGESNDPCEQARREERERIVNHLRTLTHWCDGTEMNKSDQWTMALAANEIQAMPEVD